MSIGMERGAVAERSSDALQVMVVMGIGLLLVVAALVAALLALAEKVESLPHDGPEREARGVPANRHLAPGRGEKSEADA